MAGSIEYLRPGRHSEDALCEAIGRLKGEDPLSPVTVVVRAAVAGRDLRRRVASRAAIAGVAFMPLARIAELLAAAEEGGRRPLSEPVLGAAIRASLGERPGVFANVAAHPSTEASLIAAYREIRLLDATERRRLASLSPRAADLVAIVGAAEARLRPGFYDSGDLLAGAADAVAQEKAELSALGPIIVHLPDALARPQRELLAALAAAGEVVVQLGLTGDAAADRAPRLLAGRLTALGFEEAGVEPPSSPPPSFDRVIGAPDAEEEVRICLRQLMAHLEAGGQLGDVAIVVPSGDKASYLRLVEEIFAPAEVPWTAAAAGTLGSEGVGALALALLHLLADGERAFDRAEVIALVSSPFLEQGGELLAGLDASSLRAGRLRAGALDRASRLAGVVAGEAEWRRRLGYHAARQLERGRAEAAAVARDLGRIVEWLAERAKRLDRATSWAEVAQVAAASVGALGPATEEREKLTDAVGELVHLDLVEALAPPGRGGERSAQLASALEQALGGPAPSRGRFGRGPVVGTPRELAGMRPGLLFVLGAVEGSLPGRSPVDPLLSERERASLPPLRDEERREEADRRHLLWLLSAAKKSIASYPRVGRGAARPCYPSRWLAGDLFKGDTEQVPSYAASVQAVAEGRATPADAADLELALSLLASSKPGGLAASALAGQAELARRLACEKERRAGGLSRFAGRIGREAVDEEVFAAVMSATRMESLARCPLQFMLERLARVEQVDAPDRLPVIEPKVRGTLIHEILENFVAATMEPGGAEHWGDPGHGLLRRLAAESFERAESRGLTGKDVYWQMARRRILADLERFVSLEAERLRANGAVPVRTEMAFGEDPEPPLTISLAAGRQLHFKGKVDRIDREPGGRLRVIDYKSGRDSDYVGMKTDPLDKGRHLQLPIYAKAVAKLLGEAEVEVVAEYRFCSSEAGFRTLPVALTTTLDSRLAQVLGTLADTVGQGCFPPRPGNGTANSTSQKPANCRSCTYETICRRDRFARWEEAASSAELAAYVELVQGEER